ncbi:class I SAM-dependent DNA methyltransferase [Sediminibacterium sp.]|uniref:type I restriction-modification system subunit M n=1 Tax=Sediminibacterium sp. TaxID=1917865 RepID=UPI0025F7F5DE|nr:class I SAM-dependent DNA methyltransferase [Sediminibacterium sp.]
MNQAQHNTIVNFIWSIADDVLRDVYTRGKYRDIILPFTVLRRLDAILEPTKEAVLQMHEKLNTMKIDNQAPQLRKVSGYVFYNTSKYTFKKLLNEPGNIRQNLETYLDGFSSDVQDIISKFKLRNQLETMEEGNITFPLIEKFCTSTINLSPKPVADKDGNVVMEGLTNLGMGYVFEELIRKFNEENNEEAGEHFTPREIIKLMTHLIFDPIKGKIKDGTYLIYDPACGSGGMLTEAEHFALEINPKATFHLYGQEVNPETFAICKADMLIKEEDPDKIAFGSTLSNDGFSNLQFDFMLSNPPYGKTWKIDQPAIVDKKEIIDHRFKIGVPRVNDGQLLFLMNMVSKMKKDSELGSRFATIHNGSALFTGDAGQGESEIRKYLFENDLLEAIIALPNDLFYNTGIPTYIFILTNKKDKKRKGKLQLINVTADHFNSKMRKPLGKKRVQFDANHINNITKLFLDFEPNEYSIILDNTDFGFHQITVHQPEKDEQGNIVLDSKGKPKSDAKLRDIENIPLKDNIDDFFVTEVLPFVPNAWYNAKDTKVGYEVNFAKYFYQYQAPRKLTEITKDILAIEEETENLLKEIIEA